jgi:hypothetical protein
MQYTASDYPFDIFKLFFKMKEPGTLRESQRSNASIWHILSQDCNVYTS